MILIKPGTKDNFEIIDKFDKNINYELWPYQYQLDTIEGLNGKKYRFDIYIDEDGLNKNLKLNLCASYAAHPMNEFLSHLIYGPAILKPLNNKIKYTSDDWNNICFGVWSLSCDCENYYEDDHDEICPIIKLVDKNIRGKSATIRYN